MNKKTGMARTCVLLFAAVLCLSYVRIAAAAEAGKIGYVDLRVALNESEAGKKAKIELESLIKTKQSSIDEKGKAIDKMKGDLEKQASVLSAEARKSKEDEVERQVRDYQRLVQDSQNEVKKKETEYTASIVKELRGIVEKIGQQEGYSLILENVEGIILYSKKDLDITGKVIKAFNESRAKQKK
ncbi:MAG: OmpH family outer membrane protein [Nitrospirae bacterium]|nr:OmpH family outer membrane protein [Nitrospirota bacterium]